MRPSHLNHLPKSILKSPTRKVSPLPNIDAIGTTQKTEAAKKGESRLDEFRASGQTSIPTEVLYLVFGRLSREKVTLQICALISKEWLQCARGHLIPRRFSVNIDDYHCDPIETLALLEHPLSTIGRYIHHLSVNSPSELGRRLDLNPTPRPSLDYRRFLHAFVPKCNSLRNLSVSNLDLHEFTDHKSPLHLREAFPGLLMLDIRRCIFRTYDHLFSFIGSKKRLRHLALTDINISEPDSEDSLINAFVPRNLSNLRLHTAGLRYILDWFCSQRHLPPTKSIQIGGSISYEDVDSTIGFFKRQGPFIERIKIYLGNWSTDIDLAVCPNLRELYISHIALKDSTVCGVLFDVLQQIRSKYLSHLKLHFINRPQDFADMNWGQLATLLDTPNFYGLQKLTVILTTTTAFNQETREFESGHTQEVELYIEACFPRLCQNNILNLELCDETEF